MSEKLISPEELASILGDPESKTAEQYTDLERREENVKSFLDQKAASLKTNQPKAFAFLEKIGHALMTHERGVELSLPPESPEEVRMTITQRQAEVDDIIRNVRDQGKSQSDILREAEDLREHLQAALGDLANHGTTEGSIRILYREATTSIPLKIRDICREAYERSLGGLSQDEFFGQFPSAIESIARGELLDDENDEAA